MRMINIQYIPLNQLKPDLSVKMTKNIQQLRNVMSDCMHVIAVKKNKKSNQYTIISGYDRYDYLRKHTTNKYAPCIIDDGKITKAAKSLMDRYPDLNPDKLVPPSLKIIKSYLKQDSRFSKLSYRQQLRVLLIAIRYKKTVISSMKAKVDELISW